MENQNAAYVKIMVDTLQKKKEVLDFLTEITREQEELLTKDEFSVEDFNETMEKKEKLLYTLEELDNGFEVFYERLRLTIQTQKNLYREELAKAQQLIGQITDLSVRLQAMEARNKNKLALELTDKRQEIRSFKASRQMAQKYYHNMANQHQEGQSYFLDRKK